MQSLIELFTMIKAGRPDVPDDIITKWCHCLGQLKGCHLYSVASPEKDQDDWLKQRRAGIGGSEVAAIMGESKWQSPRQVWMNKIGMFDDKPPQQSEAARWGNLLETTVAKEWSQRNNVPYIHIPVILVDDEKPWLMANIDGFTLADDELTITGILEIKTTSAYNDDIWSMGPLPFHYLCQTNWYCGITRVPQYTIVCLVGGQKLYHYTMPADAALFAKEVEAADNFWLENVQKGIEPKATEQDLEAIKEEPTDETLPALVITDDSVDKLIEAYINLRQQESKIKKVKNDLYAQLMLAMGQNVDAVTTDHTMHMKQSVRRNCLWDVLKQKYPAAYEECVFTTQSKSLDIK